MTVEERLDIIEQRLDLMRESIAECANINGDALTAIYEEVEKFMDATGIVVSVSRPKNLN
jgi:hypothetical protein